MATTAQTGSEPANPDRSVDGRSARAARTREAIVEHAAIVDAIAARDPDVQRTRCVGTSSGHAIGSAAA
jgi:DNA-binding FadR family transcriptional regulator